MNLRAIPGGRDATAPTNDFGHVRDDSLDDRAPPHDEHAERAVLATMLALPDQRATAMALLRAEQFFLRATRTVFEAMSAMHAAGEEIDMTTLASRLRETGRLKELGPDASWVANLAELFDTPIRGASVAAYARAIRDAWRMRRLIGECQRWTAEAHGARSNAGHMDGATPAQELLERVTRTATDLAADAATFTAQTSAEAVADAFGFLDVQTARSREGRAVGVPTGLAALDRMTTLTGPTLTLLGGVPSMGKSSLLLHLAMAAASAGVGVAFFSLEMPARDLVIRAGCARCGCASFVDIANGRGLSPHASSAFMAALEEISRMPIVWEGRTTKNPGAKLPTVLELKSKAERAAADARAKRRPEIGLVIVDYLQKIRETPRGRFQNAEQVVADITKGLGLLATSLDVPVLAAVALNRSGAKENRRPVMSDIRGSGQTESDADGVWLLHRDDYRFERTRSNHVFTREAEIIIAKQRNGPTGSVVVGYDAEHMRFYDLDEGDDAWRASDVPPEFGR